MTEANQANDPASETASEQAVTRPWVTPQLETHQAKELTQSGGVLITDGGGLGNDCS